MTVRSTSVARSCRARSNASRSRSVRSAVKASEPKRWSKRSSAAKTGSPHPCLAASPRRCSCRSSGSPVVDIRLEWKPGDGEGAVCREHKLLNRQLGNELHSRERFWTRLRWDTYSHYPIARRAHSGVARWVQARSRHGNAFVANVMNPEILFRTSNGVPSLDGWNLLKGHRCSHNSHIQTSASFTRGMSGNVGLLPIHQ